MSKISFYNTDADGQLMECYVLEQTVIGGNTYLLVTEEEEDDSLAYILKELRTDGEEVIYEVVDDDNELDAISRVFAEMLEDVDIEC